MAEALAICKCAILLALIICLQILSTVGRKINSMNRQELVSIKVNSQQEMANHGSSSINLHQNPTGTVEGTTSQIAPPSDHMSGSSGSSESPAANVDAFRPTPSGHSPGVGHSLLSGANKVSESMASVADHSNGKYSAAGSSDVFHPKHPGISGIGNPSAKESEGTEPKVPEGYKDDFRPTQPGFSPGVGHPLSEDSENTEPKVPADSIRKHSVAGLKDEFRPTKPGHSPGVGHAIKTKNSKK